MVQLKKLVIGIKCVSSYCLCMLLGTFFKYYNCEALMTVSALTM